VTVTDPVIDGWMVQWYVKVPALANEIEAIPPVPFPIP